MEKSTSTSEIAAALSAAAARLVEAIENEQVETLPERELQMVIAACTRAYAQTTLIGRTFPAILDSDGVTATDVVVTASALLQAARIAVFELGMWQAIKGTA
jgi:hypothetical protein